MENIFFYICKITVIISQILLLRKGFFNYVFKNDDKNIVEKTLFEQFYQEVYSSISTTIPINFEAKNKLNLECRNTIVDNCTTCSSDERTQVDFNNFLNFLSL